MVAERLDVVNRLSSYERIAVFFSFCSERSIIAEAPSVPSSSNARKSCCQ